MAFITLLLITLLFQNYVEGQNTCDNPNETLLSAARKGDLEAVESVIKCKNSNVNHVDNVGRTPLYFASEKGHTEVVQMLLEDPAIDVNLAEKNIGATALYTASTLGKEDVVELLLRHPSIDVNKWLLDTQMTPLWKASENGHARVVRLLLSHPELDINKARTNSAKTTPLGIATFLNKTEVVKLLLSCPRTNVTETGSLASGKGALEFAREKGYTAIVDAYKRHAENPRVGQACCGVLDVSEDILRAAKEGDLERLQRLQRCTVTDMNRVKRDPLEINRVDGKGRTPLYLAIKYGHIEVVQNLLKDPNIDVNRAENESGATALYLASALGNKDIVELLLRHPNINVNKGSNVTALSIASENGHAEVVKLHLRCPKTVVNLRDNFGKTALDKAREKGFTHVVEAFASRKRLLRSGHSCCSESANRELLKAAERGNLGGLDMFLQCPGVDINHSDDQGRTPLFLASENGHTTVVRKLLDFRQIDVNKARTDYGATALFAASQFGHEDIVRLLLNHPRIEVNKGLTRTSYTPLFMASQLGHAGVVELLLIHPRIDVNHVTTDFGSTALITASSWGREKVVEHLLGYPKTEVNLENDQGVTALYLASSNGHNNVVEQGLINASFENSPESRPSKILLH